jgi:hypothetical protein
MDSISVLNRILKQGQETTPYQAFTGKLMDIVRGFRVEWG